MLTITEGYTSLPISGL